MPNVRDYARILHDLAVRRGLIRIGEDIVNTAYEAPTEKGPQAQIEEAEKALYRVSESSQIRRGADRFRREPAPHRGIWRKRRRRGAAAFPAWPPASPISTRLLGGLQPSDLLILAGRPGMGKTSLATNMAFNAARAYVQDMEAGAEVPRGAPVLFFSLEMAAQQLSARILSEQTEIEMWKIRNGRFAESEWEKFVLTMQELSTLPLYIDDTGGISIAQIAARARRMKREKKIGCIIIDHLQIGRAVAAAPRTGCRKSPRSPKA